VIDQALEWVVVASVASVVVAAAFGALLTERAGVPVFYESEVFTSTEARRVPGKEIKSRSPKKHVAVDASAAALILTGYLTRQKVA